MDYYKLGALVIFGITYTGIIFTRLPGMNIDRPSAAFFGAVAMVASGILGFDEAVLSVDFNTIGLLLGMMIIITTLQMDGFFALIASHTISWSATRSRLLVVIVWITGVSSAFLVNDAVVLLFTPIIINICRKGRLNPLPYLIAEILASNIGSVMTITGNPQNMLIGINSGLSYSEFLLRLLPVSAAGLAIISPVIRMLFRGEFQNNYPIKIDTNEFRYNMHAMYFSIPVFLLVIILFFSGNLTGLSIPMIALVGATLMMILSKEKPSEIIRQVDWVLLLFFATLFIVVHGLEATGIVDQILNRYTLQETPAGLTFIHGISLFLSQIVSNVPFTVLMLPMMKSANSEILWLALASASTLAGNATIIGAMANLIVIQSAEKSGIHISFKNFFFPGIIVTLLTFIISLLVMYGQLFIQLS